MISANVCRKLSALILSGLLLSNGQTLAQSCPAWSSKVVLPYYANGQPGLTAYNGQLILTWGDQYTNYLNSAVSTDGINWTNQQTLSSFPQVYSSATYAAPPPFASGGVNMTASNSCGYAYVAYADPTGLNIYGAKSQDGITWDGGHLIWSIPEVSPIALPAPSGFTSPPSGYFPTSSPALYGGNSTLPIGFAFPQYIGWTYELAFKGSGAYTYVYGVQTGQFNCDFSNPQVVSNTCFFYDASTGACQDSTWNIWEFDEGFNLNELGGPWSPLWTGATAPGGPVELRALAQGNSLGNDNPPIWYSMNQGTVSCVGTDCAPPNNAGQWANNGIGGAVNPVDGTSILAWTCRYFNNDTCDGKSFIGFYNISNGYFCSESGSPNPDWSFAMPAVTFFNGQLWIAWRGDTYQHPGSIGVASISPSSLAPPSGGGGGGGVGGGGGGCSGNECENQNSTPAHK